MIFNPLFIGENGTTQSLLHKSGKLASNKYLFSDIVKVVMNPSAKENGKPSLNLDGINSELKLGLESEQKFVQLKYRLLTDEHSEQVKSELADILPTDIAQLLINEEIVAINDKAVSYISKEPLKGELQNFLHNLIGAEIIERNISQKSGLLLNLEDQKSAVNIELVKDSNGKSVSDKIIVQTLVVPEKSKLLSILGNGNNTEALFRTSGIAADKLFTSGSELKLTSGQSDIIKPTLSLYSFSHDGNEFESLTKSIKSNSNFKHNLDILNNSNKKVQLTSKKVPLEKISFVPGELKNETLRIEGLKNRVVESKINSDLKLVNPNEVKQESDYSVSKITIVKKQDENNILNSIKSKKELSPKEFESALRRIDFNKKIDAQKSDLHLIKNIQSRSSQSGEEKVVKSNSIKNIELENKAANNVSKEVNNSKNTESKTINIEGQINNKSTKNTIENLGLKTDKPVDLKFPSQSNGKAVNIETNPELETNNTNKPKATIESPKETPKPASKIELQTDKPSDFRVKENRVELKSDTAKLNIKEVSSNNLGNEKKTTKIDYNLKSKSNESNISELKLNNEKISKENIINTKAILGERNKVEKSEISSSPSKNNENIKSNSIEKSSPEVKTNSESKSESKNNISSQEKVTHKVSAEKVSKDNGNNLVQKVNQEVKVDSQNTINPLIENGGTKDNKQVSVKVKGEIKSVSDKNESIKNLIEDKPVNSNTGNNEGGKSENNESKQAQTSSSSNNPFEMRQNSETNFHQTLSKSEIGQVNSAEIKANFAEPKTSPQIVKSVEVIKEISKFISKQYKGTLSFDIRPEHLGKMKITLDTVDKMLKANIEVDNEQAKQLVEKNIDKLQQQLSNNGLQLNSLNISLSYSKQQRDGKKINNKTENESENLGQVGETEEEKSKKQLGYNTYEYIA